MKFITQSYIAQVNGGKTEAVNKRAEDVVSAFIKLNNAANKMADYIDRIQEDIELIKHKQRNY